MSLALLIAIPLLGGVVAWLSERLDTQLPRWISLFSCGLGLAVLAFLALPLSDGAATTDSSWLLYGRVDWIPRFGISFELGMDGLSLLLLALTFLLGIIAVAASWSEIETRPGFFQANLLWTLAGVCGVFLALDLVLFFLFWEVMLVPMYLLIAIWGHENRGYAAMKFFIFTQVSGLLMLLAIVALGAQGAAQNGSLSFSYDVLLGLDLTPRMGFWLMLGFFIAFVVKLPGFPFHTWLPDAHTQAPTAGSVLLAGILLKTGAYGLLRFTVPLFPEASVVIAPAAMTLGVMGVVYGALLAFAQTDFKRLVAYSSVSHMGFVLLGVYAFNELALQGAVLQMLTHGVSSAALFMMAGALQHRLHTRDMRQMGGLWQAAPRMGACAMFFVLASLGLPGLGNFVAEFLVLLGLFTVAPWVAAVAAVGMVTGAVYALWLMQQSFYGEPKADRRMSDFGLREMSAMAVMMMALLWMGLYPQPLLELAGPMLRGVTEMLPTASTASGVLP
ncbi:NADH-quinone oxidoreductase subunit M [Congregibacter sp.]|uniref:NADH-quinone oxidoreductase subunit M n=1 Tax=Congregibacter sp. TaxID=2744308 RepID=UPI003F6D26F6